MRELLEYTPIAAAVFAIPQFLPQILKLRATRDTAGVSWSWATLTSVNNAAWIAYFAFSGYWTALVPSSSATVLAGTLATMLALRGQATARPAVLISAWASLLILGFAVAGHTGLGALLTSAFILQVTPSIWSAYRTDRPTGISRGTWMLIFGELSCWTVFGIYKSDPRLLILGFTGVSASVLMLARIHRTSENERPRTPRFRARRPDHVPADGLRGGHGAPDRRDDHPHRPASERDAPARRPELVPAPLAGLAPEVAGRGWIDGRELGTPPALEPSRASDAWAGD